MNFIFQAVILLISCFLIAYISLSWHQIGQAKFCKSIIECLCTRDDFSTLLITPIVFVYFTILTYQLSEQIFEDTV